MSLPKGDEAQLTAEKGVWKCYDGHDWIEAHLRFVLSDEGLSKDSAAQFSPQLILHSRYDNIAGLYVMQREGGSFSHYLNREDSKVLWHSSATGGGCWVITAPEAMQLAAGSSFSSFAASAPAPSSEPPEDASWSKSQIHLYQVSDLEEEIRKEENDAGKWCDETFQPAPSSLGEGPFGKHTVEQVSWVRCPAMISAAEVPRLFNGVEPIDVLQGALGDCWLLAAVASLAEFPDYIKEQLFLTKELDGEDVPGKYRLRLFDVEKKEWEEITIDDRVPVVRTDWYELAVPLFAKNLRAEIYVMLLEKAFAKFAGCYSHLKGGAAARAWMAMTGCLDVRYVEYVAEERRWVMSKISSEPESVKRDSWGKALVQPGRPGFLEKKMKEDEMFVKLVEWDASNFMIAASISSAEVEKCRPDGLVEGHTYSIISAREIKLKEGSSIKLVQARNPWGNQAEWSGTWSDQSPLWRKHPEVRQALDFKSRDDGMFWMEWADFSAIFNQIQVCRKTMPSPRSDFDGRRRGAALSQPTHSQPSQKPKAVASSTRAPLHATPAAVALDAGAARPQLPIADKRLTYPTVVLEPSVPNRESPYQSYLRAYTAYMAACNALQQKDAARNKAAEKSAEVEAEAATKAGAQANEKVGARAGSEAGMEVEAERKAGPETEVNVEAQAQEGSEARAMAASKAAQKAEAESNARAKLEAAGRAVEEAKVEVESASVALKKAKSAAVQPVEGNAATAPVDEAASAELAGTLEVAQELRAMEDAGEAGAVQEGQE